jgi:hypothetical protein
MWPTAPLRPVFLNFVFKVARVIRTPNKRKVIVHRLFSRRYSIVFAAEDGRAAPFFSLSRANRKY